MEERIVLSLVAVSNQDTLINSTESYSQTSPVVAMDSAGDSVVVWIQAANSNTYDIDAQVYNPAGVAQLSTPVTVDDTTSLNYRPSVAMDSEGDFIVSWDAYTLPSYLTTVWARKYTVSKPAGSNYTVTPQGNQFQVSPAEKSADGPKVAMDSTSDFVIAWQAYDTSGAAQSLGVFAQLYTSSGAQGDFRVNTDTAGSQAAPAIAMDSSGNFVIAYADNGIAAASGIYDRAYSASGAPLSSSDTAISTLDTVTSPNTPTPANPSIAMEPDGQYAIAWQFTQTFGANNDDYQGIEAQTFSTSGSTELTNPKVLSTSEDYLQGDAAVAIDSGGDFVVAWESYGVGGTSSAKATIIAQRVNASGTLIGDDGSGAQFFPSTQSGDNQRSPAIANDPNGDTMFVWESKPSTANDKGYAYARLYYHVNNAPTINTPSKLTINENAGQQTVNLTGITTGTGGETETLTVTASSSNSSLINPSITYTSPDSTGALTFTPATNESGSAKITLTVMDNGGTANGGVDETQVQFTVTVDQIYIAPTISTPSNVTINENSGEQTVNLTGIAAGGGATQTLMVTASSNNSSLVHPSVTYTSPNSTGSLTFTPAANTFGTATITVTVTESEAGVTGGVNQTSVQFSVTVNQVNVPPTIDTPSNLTIDENAGEQTVDLTGITSGAAGNVTLSVTASSNDTALINPTVTYTSPNSTGTLTFTPATNMYGSATITVTVSDDGGANTTSVQFSVTVNFVNQAPTINTPSNLTIDENAGEQTVDLTGIAAGGGASETLTVMASSNNSSFINPSITYTSPNSTGTLTFTPAANSFGSATITVTVMEGGGTANGGVDETQVQFTVTVNQVAATVTAVSADWGTTGSIALQTAADGLRLLPAGRTTDLPWYGINKLQITLSQAETLSPGDVSVTGITVANYGPVTISGSGTNYTITFAKAITTADRVTVTIGNAGIATFTRRLDVLPGDVNDDGVVNTTDGVLILNNETPAHAYNIFYDINGDGVVNSADFTLCRSEIGTVLPA